MLFFLIYFFSFILLSKSFSLKPLPPWKSEARLLKLPCFWRELSSFLISWFEKSRIGFSYCQIPIILPSRNKAIIRSKAENVVENEEISLLDLTELALECILERLSPAGLCSMAGVCRSLREKCRSDHLWEKHMKEKWGRVVGNDAYREWQWHIASRKRPTHLDPTNQKGLFGRLSSVWLWPLSRIRVKSDNNSERQISSPVDSIMDWYLSIESGKFWFPAQIYNRENGHVGFVLSCYDAKISYDSLTDTFTARYSPHGRQTIEDNIEWNRVRAPAVDTPAHVLHVSDCLNDLKPEDHIEIQWRRNKEFPYGWWYGVVGHLESCDGNKIHCQCHSSDTVILEFKQYSPGSRWRQAVVNRKDHREVGNEADGFYGGIRKLYHEEEISIWRRLWPTQVSE
ncbi:hypothetical protein F0562_017579 [Nyssa sinensis]|uniref:F-box domain-containing protein n=1 Tax=Nyssa sinensis TaxID=561372 RepID=A0A5J4ZI09_9ASTE|nr:hypothetical protein F0562_017579 [Nyssa sinensis]